MGGVIHVGGNNKFNLIIAENTLGYRPPIKIARASVELVLTK